MNKCACCGNSYDKGIHISTSDGRTYYFDSFECAIQVLAPKCSVCGVRIIGHGIEGAGRMFCCACCAERGGISGIVDRVA